NLVLTDFLTLYDVLVVPEYCVSLVSVHKVARDSKLIVGFVESKCFVMSQDLMDVRIMEIGKQVGGLYYFDRIQGEIHLNLCSEVNKSNQDLDHVNFFDEVVYEGLDKPCDDTNLDDQPHNEGSNSYNPSSPTIDHVEDNFGHPQCSNGSASENEMVVTSGNDFAIYEGDIADILDT
ncbi:hypothetical protein Tco_1547107, partial [Tanacetum coccineum]